MRQVSSRTQAFGPHVIRLHGTLLDGSGSRGVDGTIIRRFAEAGCRPAQQDAIAAGADSSIPSTARTALCACAAAALAERPDLLILLTDRLCGNRIGVDGGAGVRMSNPHRLPAAELDSPARPRADRGSLLAPRFCAGSAAASSRISSTTSASGQRRNGARRRTAGGRADAGTSKASESRSVRQPTIATCGTLWPRTGTPARDRGGTVGSSLIPGVRSPAPQQGRPSPPKAVSYRLILRRRTRCIFRATPAEATSDE